MNDKVPPHLIGVSKERVATEFELKGAINVFEAACYRGDAVDIQIKTDLVHEALQRHLDTISGTAAIQRRAFGID